VLHVADNRYFITAFETDLANSINKKYSKGCGNGWSNSVGKAGKSKHIREQLLLCIYSQVSTDKRVKVQNVDSATCCACCINPSDISVCWRVQYLWVFLLNQSLRWLLVGLPVYGAV